MEPGDVRDGIQVEVAELVCLKSQLDSALQDVVTSRQLLHEFESEQPAEGVYGKLVASLSRILLNHGIRIQKYWNGTLVGS